MPASPTGSSNISPHTSFNSTPLVRLLAGLEIANVSAAKQTFAERLSPWLDWTAAISLSAALHGEALAAPAKPQPAAAALVQAAARDFQRLHQKLTRAISTDRAFAASKTDDDDADAAAPRRRCLEHQRLMEEQIAALRGKLRTTLSALGPAGGRLAALDAVMEKALGARERQLLATVPSLLEKHFKHIPETKGDTPAHTTQFRNALLAELDLRLQPLQGLIEALGDLAQMPINMEASGPA